MDEQRERELKFEVPDAWEMPRSMAELPAGATIERETVHLQSTYYDTPDLDLIRARLTLRRRTGDTDAGWQLKVPSGDARTELRLPLTGETVPSELLDVTQGVRAGAELEPIAVVDTERSVHRIVGADGSGLAEIAVDAVTGAHETTIRRWREVEIELLGGDELLLDELASWLQNQGASPSRVGSKLARTIGRESSTAPDLTRLGGLIAAYLEAQYREITGGDVGLRRGHDAIHDTRVATRRYRSILRVFAKLLDRDRAAALDEELKWYAAELGEVRDRQVLRAHLDDELDGLPPELVMGPVADRVRQTLDREQDEAESKLAEAMRGERYLALIRELRCWHEQLPLTDDGPADTVEKFVRKAVRKVKRRIRAVPSGEGRAPALHAVRKAAKRARYTAELSEPESGKSAAALRKRMKKLQDRLGAGQDAVIAVGFLRRLGAVAGSTAGENGFTFGLLYQRELDRIDHAERSVR